MPERPLRQWVLSLPMALRFLLATERLALTPSGQVRYALKTPYRDGTTHIVLEPLDLMARLAARVPPPRMHLRSTPASAARDGCGGVASIEEPEVIARILAQQGL